MHPLAQRFGSERIKQRFNVGASRAVAGKESLDGFGMREIHAAFTGEQKLAADRWHGVVQIDVEAAADQNFRSHEPGWPAADNRNGWNVNVIQRLLQRELFR